VAVAQAQHVAHHGHHRQRPRERGAVGQVFALQAVLNGVGWCVTTQRTVHRAVGDRAPRAAVQFFPFLKPVLPTKGIWHSFRFSML
jgi:hypothetical protein